jgi:hypothetical protein
LEIQTDAMVVEECILGKRTIASLYPIIAECVDLMSMQFYFSYCILHLQTKQC